ncbi:MAG: hypothetical protein HRU13_06735, partial [Phycisphaerales bacterium]|nr:hypothetical protein [Phycisphaerales bacterium]
MTAIFNGTSQAISYATTGLPTTLDTDGIWMSRWVYVPSTPSAFTFFSAVALASSVSGNYYGLGINAEGKFVIRWRSAGGPTRHRAGATATAGWHLVTGWWRQGSGTNVSLTLYVDGNAAVSATNQSVGSLSISYDRYTFGARDAASSQLWYEGEIGGAGIGTGDPDGLHPWLWNGGSAREMVAEGAGYDFDGDADAAIIAYHPLDKEATATIDSTDTEAQDSVGGLDTVTNTGSTVWSTRVAPFNSGVTPQVGTNGTPALAASGTDITLSVTLADNDWASPFTFDTNDIDVSALKGYGPISVSSASAVVDGGDNKVLNVTLDLSRTVYAEEDIAISFKDGWLTDNDGNTGGLEDDVAVTTTGGASGSPATSTTWSMGRTVDLTVNATLATARAGGFLAGGIPYIVFPSDTNVTALTPAQASEDQGAGARTINGAGLNLERTAATLAQPWNQHESDLGFGDNWDATNLFTPTAAFGQNDAIIKSIARAYADIGLDGADDYAFVDYFAGFMGLASAPSNPANTVIPLVGYDGTSTRPAFEIDFDSIVSGLPSYSVNTGDSDYHTPAQTIRRFCQLCAGRYLGRDVGGRYFVPTSFVGISPSSDTDADGYGRDFVRTISYALIHIMGDQATTVQKRQLVEWVCIHGCNAYEATKEYAEPIRSRGALDQGMLPMVALFLHWSNQDSLLATLQTV